MDFMMFVCMVTSLSGEPEREALRGRMGSRLCGRLEADERGDIFERFLNTHYSEEFGTWMTAPRDR